jgi:2-polyprenyl-6-methoxyphenol hydroxylase-like FAD-dependent oxidoreductase
VRLTGAVLIVGGGPAGASAALALRADGFDVALLEQRSHWTGRVCGAFMSPEAVHNLTALGILGAIRDAGAAAVDTAVVTAPSGCSVTLPVGQGGGALALPRHALEDTLLELVRRSGATVEMGTRAVAVRWEDPDWAVDVRSEQAGHGVRRVPLVVLADGRFTMGAAVKLRPFGGWFGWNASFRGVPRKPGELSLHLFPGGYVGVLPFADGTANACGLAWFRHGPRHPWQAVWENALDRSKPLRDLMYAAERIDEWRSIGPLPYLGSMRRGGGPILAGDAAGVGDPFMGEGIGRALGTGPLLAHCLATAGAGDVRAIRRAYEREWRARYARRQFVGRQARRILGNPWLVPLGLWGLTRSGPLLQRLLPLLHGFPGRPAPGPAA